jgi:hypothetical protein
LKLVFGLSLECLRTATKILRIVDFLPEIWTKNLSNESQSIIACATLLDTIRRIQLWSICLSGKSIQISSQTSCPFSCARNFWHWGAVTLRHPFFLSWVETDAATVWPIVPAQDDRWWWLWSNRLNANWQGKPKYSEKTCPSATLSTTNPTWLNRARTKAATVRDRRLTT